MMPTRFYFLATCVFVFTILHLLPAGQCGRVPNTNEQVVAMPKVPQWHCLRYFKHDIIMMRRCRHLRVPKTPRARLNGVYNYNVDKTTDTKNCN